MAEQSGQHGRNSPVTATRIRIGGDPEDKPIDPGMVCLECGTELTYTGYGRRPRYCSSSCRHRAWERRRAANDGVIAKEVVELPALPLAPTYTRAGVIEWLRGNPRRLADVLGALPETKESAEILAIARYRLWSHGVYTDADQLTQSQAEKDLVQARAELNSVQQEVKRLNEENRQLRAVREQQGLHASSVASSSGLRHMEINGRTFHVPQHWSRQQARKWCRDHPDQAVEGKYR